MWSLLCAVGLVVAVSVGDPRSIQIALVENRHPRTSDRFPTTLLAESDDSDSRFRDQSRIESIAVNPSIAPTQFDRVTRDRIAANPSDAATAVQGNDAGSSVRVATADVGSLQIDRGSLGSQSTTNGNANRTDLHRSLFRPPPEPGTDLALDAHSHRPVPEPLLDPFEDDVVDVETHPAIDETRIAEIASSTIEQHLAELRAQVVAAYRARPLPVDPSPTNSNSSQFELPRRDRLRESIAPPRPPLRKPLAPRLEVVSVPGSSVSSKATPLADENVSPKSSMRPSTGPVTANKPVAEEISSGRFRLRIADSTVPEVLQLLSEVGGRNIVASESVEGTVRYNLHDVSVDEALSALAKVHDLSIDETDSFVFIETLAEAAERPSRASDLPLIIPGTPRRPEQRWDRGPIARETSDAIRK